MEPPKENAPAKGRSSKLTAMSARGRAYHLLRAFQGPFGLVSWALEQRIAQVDVQTERQRT
jgi:hypothetical protein